jgi:hypothetical protein
MSERRAFTMLKHCCAALLIFTMPKHRCAALVTFFLMLKHHCSAPFIFFPFPKQLRPAPVSPFSLLLLKHHYQQLFIFPFPLLKHRYQQPFTIFPDAETLLFSIFHFFPLPKHSSPPFSHYFHYRNNSVQHLFRLSPFCC